MQSLEITGRTKTAVRKWASVSPDKPLVLDETLDSLRPNAREELRRDNNSAFKGQKGFPILKTEWDPIVPDLDSVRDLRDLNKTRLA